MNFKLKTFFNQSFMNEVDVVLPQLLLSLFWKFAC